MTVSHPRVAFIVQRCGDDVNGGAEALCLAVARHMQSYWNVEILTTCAIDYMTWADDYPPGETTVQSVPVRRFSVPEPRDIVRFNTLSDSVLPRANEASREQCEQWMREQGPVSPGLLAHLDAHRRDYDAFIFFTYLYATTYQGLPLVADRAWLVPTAHDEPPMQLPIWDDWFKLPQGFVFNTPEERRFLKNRFPTVRFDGEAVGMGLDSPPQTSPKRFREKYNINDPYLLYVGRIDPSKGCTKLFDYFRQYKHDHDTPLKLVLIGTPVMTIPEEADIVAIGFVDEQSKFDAIAGAEVIVNPSPFESLSIILLEAWQLNRPVLVSAESDVMVSQCKRSNGGLWYSSYQQFVACLLAIKNNTWIAKNAHSFVREHYSWRIIEHKYKALIGEPKQRRNP